MASDYWVSRLNPVDASIVWPKALPLLRPAIALAAALYAPDHVRDLVTQPSSGTASGWSLWIIAERDQIVGAWTTNVRHYPRIPVLEIAFAGGSNMKPWYDLALSETDKFARECDCDRIFIAGRGGWAGHGYRRVGHLLERRL